jgi:flagellar L-ring protein precursor FlgH
LCAVIAAAASAGESKEARQTPLDRYVEEATRRNDNSTQASPSSLWSPGSRLIDMGSDLRARNVDDLVTILVLERATAISSGTTKSSRKSNANASFSAAGGLTRAAGVVNASGETTLAGEGATSRESSLSTTLSARVTQVLPNGYLVVEGNREIQVNSERQTVTVRGVVRPNDLSTDNVVPSTQIAQMEIRISGRGVVGDAVRRPFILYRILLGLLPF